MLNACRGEYIACLEGDDYWFGPRKLQKQVALMDLNPQYSMCGTAVRDVRLCHRTVRSSKLGCIHARASGYTILRTLWPTIRFEP